MAEEVQLNPDGSEGADSTKLNILVATPCYGGMMHVSYARSIQGLIQVFNHYGVRHSVIQGTNESLIPRGRNVFANMVCFDRDSNDTPYTHLLFIDADIGFNAENIIQALGWNKDIVALPYPCKSIEWDKIVKAVLAGKTDPEFLRHVASRPIINTNVKDTTFDISKPVQFPQLGTGLLLIKREVLMKFTEDPARRYKLMEGEKKGVNRDFAFDFFQIGINPESRYYDSEDYRFCLDARKLGFETWLLPWAVTSHTGGFEFIIDMPAMASVGIPAVGENPKEI
jgi:hypothetical protein